MSIKQYSAVDEQHGCTACIWNTVRGPCPPVAQVLGPIVRVSPTLCSIADPEELKTVYGGKFPKSKARYQGKAVAGVEHMLVLRQPSEVKARRGLLLPLFQRGNLDGFFEEITRYTAQLLEQMIEEQNVSGSVDVFRWLRLMAFDVIGTCSLSGRFGH